MIFLAFPFSGLIDIKNHFEPYNNCELLSSTQAGPILLPEIDLEKEFSGVLKKNISNLFTTPRSTNQYPKKNECEADATTLINAGESNWVGDENIFRDIFLKKSPEELVLISRIYLKKTGKNLLDIVDKKY